MPITLPPKENRPAFRHASSIFAVGVGASTGDSPSNVNGLSVESSEGREVDHASGGDRKVNPPFNLPAGGTCLDRALAESDRNK